MVQTKYNHYNNYKNYNMRIAIFSDTFLPQINGVVSFLTALISGLAGKGHKIILFVPKPARGEKINFKARNCRIVTLPSLPALLYPRFRLSVPFLPLVLKELKNFKPEVIHVHDPLVVSLTGVLTARILKKPLVANFHSYFLSEEFLKVLPAGQRNPFLKNLLKKYAKIFYNRADTVVCPSKTLAEELVLIGIKKPVRIIPIALTLPGFDKRKLLENRQGLIRKFALKEKTALYVGRVSPEKSLEVLLKAFAEVAAVYPSANLLIVGSGPAGEKIKKLAFDSGLRQAVRFLGEIPHEKIFESGIYEAADLFATASAFEVQPMSVLEAMAKGLPVVGVDAGGMRDIIGGNGFLCPKNDVVCLSEKMLEIFNNQALKKKMGEESKKQSRRYSSAKIIREYEELYKKAVDF